jgi:hypothetical protein
MLTVPPERFAVMERASLAGLFSFFVLTAFASVSTFAGEADYPGLHVFTSQDQDNIPADTIGIRLNGPIMDPLDKRLAELLLNEERSYRSAVLELDSEGGELEAVKKVAGVLKKAAMSMELTTRVMEGATCASGCIVLFMQAPDRRASGASAWVFHGACSAHTNVPSLSATSEYLDQLTDAGVKTDFVCDLVQKGYVTSPGSFVLSGYELFHNYDANIITSLFPAWRPQKPRGVWRVEPH